MMQHEPIAAMDRKSQRSDFTINWREKINQLKKNQKQE